MQNSTTDRVATIILARLRYHDTTDDAYTLADARLDNRDEGWRIDGHTVTLTRRQLDEAFDRAEQRY